MIKDVLLCLCLTLAPVWSAPVQEDSGPVAVLKHGSVRGQYVKAKGSPAVVEQYLGIPFAQPPVGPHRLAAPQPVQGWEGIRNATEHPLMCLQNPDILPAIAKAIDLEVTAIGVSEDCLYLNVYTPSQRAESEKLPVMIWIHGGGLAMGGACMFKELCLYDGTPLAAYEKVVVVVIQYRLGILGYFSTGDQHAKGNWGFLDQIAALQWVQQNIEAFGGDPQSVTIAGESAGGISASLLTLSPMTKGLFQRAIFQSGVATVKGYFVKDPSTHAQVIANITECDFSSSEVLVKCIREMTEEQIIKAAQKKGIFPGAAVDGEFIKAQPEEILKSKDFQKVPILIGTTNHEFGWMLPQIFLPKEWVKGMDTKAAKDRLGLLNADGASGANGIIADEYFKNAKTPEEIRDAFTELLGDIFMVIPSITVASYHREAGVPVYMYEFQHGPSTANKFRPSFVKADHADDVGFVFGACFWDVHVKGLGTLTEEENQLCRTVMKYRANFIRTGSPNPAPVPWPVYDQSNKYLNLGLQQTEGQDLKKDKLLFFTEELPKKLAAPPTA
ncbi:carboxylesterase 2a precursor [Danio rerio]|uniref:Carboxylic ester hydrolase n=2 Tax=Bilateria TaxID=33213 RepID=Q08BF1_DANRE|nr:carboxylesterase 2a precursor [Danio rerio]AAI24755.1 Zgc:153863 [Danio rerio]|eukprot:NP_001070720.1 carboxylesterase 2-like precursor [Danio rerio]